MKELFRKSFQFIREYPETMSSLAFLILIPLTIFFNTFFILSRFQGNIDSITHSKAILAENIANVAALDYLDQQDKLNLMIAKTMENNEEIRQFEILYFDPQKSNFKVFASSEKENVGKENNEVQNVLAWNKEEGIAFLGTDGQERVWKVTKIFKNKDGEKAGLIALALSLGKSDSLINSTISWSYLTLIITILIVLLLIANNTRIIGYAFNVYRLKEIDKLKDNFISMASHELRSPLVSIKGNLDFLKSKTKTKLTEEEIKYLENIDFSAKRLDKLVEDILESSRLEGNRIPFNITNIDPLPIIEECITEMKNQVEQKNLQLIFSPSSLPFVKADKERLKQIIINLLSNAIKYTPKGTITVKAEEKNNELLITVADTGMGISSEDQSHIFEKFYRIKISGSHHIVGSGLGLWITRELARKMNGDITVESIKDVGSHFTLHIPLAKK